MENKLTTELNFFKSHPLSMRTLLLTNLIYAMVQHGDRNDRCCNQRRPEIAEQQEQDDDDQQRPFGEVLFNCRYGSVHQFGTIVKRVCYDASGQRRSGLL